MKPVPPTRTWGLLPDCAGIALWAVSLVHFVDRMDSPINTFDEGFLLTNANLLLMGEVIHRDFYSCYPPGIFLLLAGLWKVTGVSVLAGRFLGLFIHVAIAALVGRLAGRLVSRTFLFWPAGLCGLWMVALAPSPFPYLAAVACALLSIELVMWALSHPRSSAWLVPGFALGCVAALRHDLFVYIVAALVPAAVGVTWRRQLPLSAEMRPRLAWACAGLLASLLPIWLPAFWQAGFTWSCTTSSSTRCDT